MFCRKCGGENVDGDKFCKHCGHPIGENAENQTTQNTAVEKNDILKSINVNQLMDKIKVVPKKIIAGVLAVIILIPVIIGLIMSSAATIKLDQFIIIEANGYDGYGTVRTSIDWDAIEQKYEGKISFTKKAKDKYGVLLEYLTPIDALKESVNIELSQTENLHNGDNIPYSWNIEEDISEYIKCKIKAKDGSYEISGLSEVTNFDAFEALEISFEGISPNANLEYNYTGEELSYYDFKASSTYGLKNGDIVTMSLTNTNMEYYAENLGMVPEKLEKEYLVEGLNEYVSEYSKIDSDYINELKSEAEDQIYSYVANNYNNTNTLTNLQYEGYIFNFIKEDKRGYDDYNKLYIIYSGTVTNSEGKMDPTKVYYPVKITQILNGEEGFSCRSDYGIAGNSYISGYSSTKGYINPLTCYIELAANCSENYDSESGDGFEEYSQYDLISALSDISDEYKETLKTNAIQSVEKYIESNYNGGSIAEELKFEGEYLLVLKEQGTNFANNNKYILVCSAVVSNTEGYFETEKVYFPVEYSGIVKLPKDEYMYTSTNGILGTSYFEDSWYSTKGYISGTEMYSKVVTANRDNYKYEVSDSLKEFGN